MLHAAGVSLMFRGETLSNDSFVDLDDVVTIGHGASPSNANLNGALLCITNLEDCCASPHTVRGDWYYPDGSVVQFNGFRYGAEFQANRGQNEIRNGR